MDKIEISRAIARNLLQIKAIKFNFEEYFTWASGWKSPIYCDNRISMSDVGLRNMIRDAFIETIQTAFPDVEVIAGVATGAIAQSALVADRLNLPLIYVREKAKDHGMKKVIEGIITPGQKAVILEDLISTGGSSLKATHEVRNAGAQVLGMTAIFTYEFPIAKNYFNDYNCELHTLSSYSTLIEVAREDGYINQKEVDMLKQWHESDYLKQYIDF